ncbi:MAG: hypothetical protein ACI4WF_01525 [Bacilli bacterium]
MRMDRYNDNEEVNESLKTRTNKNQELYTDVYMNNVCVDINNLKHFMQEDNDLKENENLKLIKENKLVDVKYEDKIYNINTLIEEALASKKDDNLKRSIDTKVDDLEINNLIESINENKKENEKEVNDGLLVDLMPSDNNTAVIPPLDMPILEDSYQENKINKDEKEEEKELVNDDKLQELDKDLDSGDDDKNSYILEEDKLVEVDEEKKDLLAEEKDDEVDEEELIFDEKTNRKIVLIVLIILFLIALVIGFLIYRKIIKI